MVCVCACVCVCVCFAAVRRRNNAVICRVGRNPPRPRGLLDPTRWGVLRAGWFVFGWWCYCFRQVIDEERAVAASKFVTSVNLDVLLDFIFPAAQQHPNSTGRLIVYGLYVCHVDAVAVL